MTMDYLKLVCDAHPDCECKSHAVCYPAVVQAAGKYREMLIEIAKERGRSAELYPSDPKPDGDSEWKVQACNALRDSIEHWERMKVEPGCGEVPGISDCACCKVYDQCDGCPIALRTDDDGCDGTPWRAAFDAWDDGSAAWSKLAQEMINYLLDTLEMVENGEVKP